MDYANGGYLKTVLDIKAGEQTVLSFRNEGEYETAVEDIYLDVIPVSYTHLTLPTTPYV